MLIIPRSVLTPVLSLFCILVVVCCGIVSCARNDRPGAERVAVVPFQNISGDPGLDWAAALPAAIISAELSGSASINVRAAASVRDAVTFRAERIVHGYLTGVESRLEVHAVIMNAGGRKIEEELRIEGAGPAGILEASRAIVRHFGGPDREFGTEDTTALREFGFAFTIESAEDRLRVVERALAADPGFGEAAVAKAELLAGLQRSEAASEWLTASLARGDGFDPLTRARLQYLQAARAGVREAVTAAILNLASQLPADVSLARQAAQQLTTERRYREGADWYARAAEIDPNEPSDWNSQAYSLAYAGDLDGALRSVRRYRELEPGSPNGWDSEGEILYRFGRYEEAGDCFLKSNGISPDFNDSAALFKAARCRMMSGDIGGGDELFERYVVLRKDAQDPDIEIEAARWHFETGRRRQALDELETLIGREGVAPDLAAAGTEQLALWRLLMGDRDTAGRRAREGAKLATTARTRGANLAQAFLAMKLESADQWREAAARQFPHPQQLYLRQGIMATALLLSGLFGDAVEPLRALDASSAPFNEDTWGFLLAWALFESGDTVEAGEMLQFNPLSHPGTSSVLDTLIFPRILYLRGALAAEAGNDAARDLRLRLFLRYSGDLELSSGEEQKARRLLGLD